MEEISVGLQVLSLNIKRCESVSHIGGPPIYACCYIYIIISCSAFIWAMISFSLGTMESRLSWSHLPHLRTTTHEPTNMRVSNPSFAFGALTQAGMYAFALFSRGFSSGLGSSFLTALTSPVLGSYFLITFFL